MSDKARALQPDLQIGPNVFNESATRALIDDWLAPAIADLVIRDLLDVRGNDKG